MSSWRRSNCVGVTFSLVAYLNNDYLPYKFDAIIVQSGCFPFIIEGYSYLQRALGNQTTPIFFITGSCDRDYWYFVLFEFVSFFCEWIFMWIRFSWLGTSDCLCPPDRWDAALYQVSPSTCKYLANIVDGGHCGFAWDGEGNIPCKVLVDSIGMNWNVMWIEIWLCRSSRFVFGWLVLTSGCFLDTIIPVPQQQKQTVRYMLPFLDFQLKGLKQGQATLNIFLAADKKSNLVQYSLQCSSTSRDM